MLNMRELEQAVLAKGQIDSLQLECLRRELYSLGKINRPQADFLVGLRKQVRQRSPAFEHFFYQAIKDHILVDGWIDGENAVWLRRMLLADDKIDDGERKLLHELKVEAKHVSREFDALYGESTKSDR